MTEPFRYRDADGNLRLDEALGERYVKHYVKILSSSNEQFAAMQLAAAVQAPPPGDTDAHWYAWQEPRAGIRVIDGQVLVREGAGPEECSSSQALALRPEIIWDVCGYYRRLGFHWTEFRQVTPRRLRLRYLRLDPRQEDHDLFYALEQLLDPVVRRAYDQMPLGGLFLGDRNVRAVLERLAALEASRRNAEAADDPWSEETDQGRVLREWGFQKAGVNAAEARERLREEYSAEPMGTAGGALGITMSGWDRDWSYYRLLDPYDDLADTPDLAALEAWQAFLCSVLSAHGRIERFSVGVWPGSGPKLWRDSKGSCIFFMGNERPTQSTASEAVEGYLAQEANTKREAQACPF